MIGKLSGLLVSRSAGPLESAVAAAPSPRSPLDFKIQSPRGPRSYDLGGVGLGIVAALEKPGDAKILLLPKGCAACGPGANGSGPSSAGARAGADNDMEDYTYVTFHGPNQSFTMVYYGEGERGGAAAGRGGCGKSGGLGGSMRRAGSVGGGEGGGEGPVLQALDFLNSCHLCGKKLHGEDIYMYRYRKLFPFFFDSRESSLELLFFSSSFLVIDFIHYRGQPAMVNLGLESCSGREILISVL